MTATQKMDEGQSRPIFEDVKDLRSLREELKLQAHLLKAEAREKWMELENRWNEVELKLGALQDETTEAAKSVAAATRGVIDELREQYRALKEERSKA